LSCWFGEEVSRQGAKNAKKKDRKEEIFLQFGRHGFQVFEKAPMVGSSGSAAFELLVW
jgi:hypothetical protein